MHGDYLCRMILTRLAESSGVEMTGNAQMSAHHIDEGGISLGGQMAAM